jgi:3-phenylpropionate/cinnamic acid dioxygenase small subunit
MPTLDRREAEDLLYAEARLLDELRYDEWLNLLTADILYWIPCNGSGTDPARQIAIAYDDSPRLHDRVGRLATGIAHAQSPPSQTRRLISNVQIEEAAGGTAQVVSAFILYELRRGRERVFAGHYEHRLRFEDGRWKIAVKKTVLVNNDEVIDNLTFIV